MKKTIWIGRCSSGLDYYSENELKIDEMGKVVTVDPSESKTVHELYVSMLCFLNVSIEGYSKVIELVHDTETQKLEVKIKRNKGWYLARETTRCLCVYWYDGNDFWMVNSRFELSTAIDDHSRLMEITPIASPFLKELP